MQSITNPTNKCILLGTFTIMEEKMCQPTIEEMIVSLVDSHIPIEKSKEIGHKTDSKALVIGKYLELI